MSKTPSHRWLLTTTDNPFNPFTEYVQWYLEDVRIGHDTCGLIARLSAAATDIDDDSDLAVMRDIVTYNFSGKHIMVSETTLEDTM